jgi:hypothetical protein
MSTTPQRPRGRAVPSYAPERIAAGWAAFEAARDDVTAYARALPERVPLGDGRVLRLIERGQHNVAYTTRGGLKVLASLDPTPHGLLRHISASYAGRLPSWAELGLLRAAFFPPDIDVIQVFPRAGEYINAHAYCLHLFEAPGEWQGGLFV